MIAGGTYNHERISGNCFAILRNTRVQKMYCVWCKYED